MPRAATAAAVRETAPARRHPAPRTRRPVAVPRRAPRRRVSGPVRLPIALPKPARVLDALLTGRVWIACVGVLLAGIVFFNVDLLRMNRDITQMADKASTLKRENARLRLDVAHLASSERIQEAAAQRGLVLPKPDQVRYLRSDPRADARLASKRIIAPNGSYVAPAPTASTLPAPDPAATDVTQTGTDPAATATTTPTDPTTAQTDPTTTTTAPTTTATPPTSSTPPATATSQTSAAGGMGAPQ